MPLKATNGEIVHVVNLLGRYMCVDLLSTSCCWCCVSCSLVFFPLSRQVVGVLQQREDFAREDLASLVLPESYKG